MAVGDAGAGAAGGADGAAAPAPAATAPGAPLAWPDAAHGLHRPAAARGRARAPTSGSGIVGNTFDDTASGVGVPQHDFFQYYAGGHNWNLGLDPYLNHPDDRRRDPAPAA